MILPKMVILMHFAHDFLFTTLSPCPIHLFMTSNNILENQSESGNENFNFSELRKRRGSYPQLSKSEILSAEMLAPLPQGNISRTISRDFQDDETKPLLEVKEKNIIYL